MSRLMNVKLFAWAVVALLSSSVFAEGRPHAPTGHAGSQAQAGKRLETDSVLKSGMDGIRQAMLARRAEIEADSLKRQDYQRLAEMLDQHITRIVQNCKLSPEADRAFHGIVLADLMRDTALMRTSPKVQVQRVSALGIFQTLRHYGENFQHPGWSLDASPPQQP